MIPSAVTSKRKRSGSRWSRCSSSMNTVSEEIAGDFCASGSGSGGAVSGDWVAHPHPIQIHGVALTQR